MIKFLQRSYHVDDKATFAITGIGAHYTGWSDLSDQIVPCISHINISQNIDSNSRRGIKTRSCAHTIG